MIKEIARTDTEKCKTDVIVRQSHAMIRAKVGLPLLARKLLYLLLHKVNGLAMRNPGDPVTIDADMWKKYTESKNPYRDLKNAVDALYDGNLVFHPDFERDPESEYYVRILTGKHYFPRQAKISVFFNQTINAHISNLVDFQHGRTQLLSILEYKSVYAMDLYDLICQFRDTGILNINLFDLKYALNVENKYKDIRAFKKHCLDKPLSIINKSTNIDIKYKSKKIGRSISGFIFTYKKF